VAPQINEEPLPTGLKLKEEQQLKLADLMNLGGLSFHGTNSDFKSISQYKSAMSALTEKVETNP